MKVKEKEIWKDIISYEGLYQISNKGRVKSLSGKSANINKAEIILKPYITRGYFMVRFSKKGKEKAHYIHRLIAEAFIDNPNNKPQVNHINFKKLDNRIKNLEWVTNRENTQHWYNSTKRSSKYAGVSRYYNGMYVAQFSINGKVFHLGYYKSEERAAMIYKKVLLIHTETIKQTKQQTK